jgi:hypothetical protein
MKKEQLQNAKKVRVKLHQGERIEDDELDDAIYVYEIVSDFLHCDRHLHLAWKEIYLEFEDLQGFKEARKRNKTWNL